MKRLNYKNNQKLNKVKMNKYYKKNKNQKHHIKIYYKCIINYYKQICHKMNYLKVEQMYQVY